MTCSARPTGGGILVSDYPGNRSCLADPWAVLNRPFRPGVSEFDVRCSMFDPAFDIWHWKTLSLRFSCVLSCPLRQKKRAPAWISNVESLRTRAIPFKHPAHGPLWSLRPGKLLEAFIFSQRAGRAQEGRRVTFRAFNIERPHSTPNVHAVEFKRKGAKARRR